MKTSIAVLFAACFMSLNLFAEPNLDIDENDDISNVPDNSLYLEDANANYAGDSIIDKIKALSSAALDKLQGFLKSQGLCPTLS